MAIFYGKRGEMRLYDAGSPKSYCILKFHGMDANVPEGANRPEENSTPQSWSVGFGGKLHSGT